MIENKKAPFTPPSVVNVLYTPSSNQYVYAQQFVDDLKFTVTADSDVHVLFSGKDIERELVVCTSGTTRSEVRTSAAGSPLASTDTLRLNPAGSTVHVQWDAAMRVFEIAVDSTSWTASLPAGAKMNPFTRVSFSTGGGVTGMFVLGNDPVGTDYGYGDFEVPKPKKQVAKPVKKTSGKTLPTISESEVAEPSVEPVAEPVAEHTEVKQEAVEAVEAVDEVTGEKTVANGDDVPEKKPVRKTRGRKKK